MSLPSSMRLGLGFLSLVVLAAPAARADVPIPLTITGNEATSSVAIGAVSAELAIVFESATGLDASSIVATARLISPLDLGLLLRLPSGVSVPLELPLLIKIEPSATSSLAFHGVMALHLHTELLDLRLDLPLSLFSAPVGGSFKDITASEAAGSYRVCGDKGSMSEFLILVDIRGIDGVITGKFDALQATLTANAGSMPPATASGLQARLNTAKSLHQGGETAAARDEIAAFAADVVAQSGTAIPDVWQAHTSLVNVAGLLRAGADTLKFSLSRKLAGFP